MRFVKGKKRILSLNAYSWSYQLALFLFENMEGFLGH